MPAFDFMTDTIAVPTWALGVFAALFIGAFVMAIRRSESFGSIAALAGIAVAVAWSASTLADRSAQRELAAERQALDMRAAELTARAIAPGSVLSCLDANAGETVENSCEKALFATPQTAAAATAYVSARLLLLADGLDYAGRAERGYNTALAGLRRAIEADRFGIVAHVMATRDGCTAEQCAAFALLRNADMVKANLKARTYESNVARYAASWSEPNTAAAAAVVAPAGAPSAIDFPTAASIPPVSIMNPEPASTASVSPEPNALQKPAAAVPSPARRPAANAAAAPPRNAPAAATPRAQ